MLKNLIINDLKKSKLTSLTVTFFILVSSFLLGTVGIVSSNLKQSIDSFVEKAKSPHYLQMHIGDFNEERMNDFSRTNAHVKDYQHLPFLNVDNSDIIINDQPKLKNFQDNGFTYQSQNFDFLLDMNNEIIEPEEGMIYVPLAYYNDKTIKEGDTISVNKVDFKVIGPLRDSQMNSTLSSSKRFLINEKDYKKIKEIGQEEHLIEFLLKDKSKTSNFEADYTSHGLEKNGPTITYSIIKLMNALTDGIMIAILILISLLILLLSFLCIRFTLISKIEDEYREIGLLKAIGIRVSKIKKLYLAKYVFISSIASLLGFILSLIFSNAFIENIVIYMGKGNNGYWPIALAICSCLLIFLAILLYINHVLNRFKKISPAQAINAQVMVNGNPDSQKFKLRACNFLSKDSFLGLSSVLSRKKIYLSLFLILIISNFLIVLPNNIKSTLSSKDFINYMGFGNIDGLITIRENGNRKNNLKKILDALGQDSNIKDYMAFDSKNYQVILGQNNYARLWTNLGDYSSFSGNYTKGRGPMSPDEIALSSLSSEDLNIHLGDKMNILTGNGREIFEVVGIYSDITNGGKTARMSINDEKSKTLFSNIQFTTNKDVNINQLINEYSLAYPEISIYHITSYINDTFGSTIKSVNKISILALILSLSLVFLITLLFISMLVSRDSNSISILKAIGLNRVRIKRQYRIGSGFIAIIAIILGTLLANSLGKLLTGFFIKSIGIGDFTFIIDKLFVYIISPLLLVGTVLIATKIGLKKVDYIMVSDHIKE